MLVEVRCFKCGKVEMFPEESTYMHICKDCMEAKRVQEAKDTVEEEAQDRAMAEFDEEEARNEIRAEEEERDRIRAKDHGEVD